MIIDNLNNINLYKEISDDIYSGLGFLQNVNSNIELGTYNINNRVKAIIESYNTELNKEQEFESHKHVVDIQCPVIGIERVFWSPITDMKIKTPYDKLKDKTIFINSHKNLSHVDIGNGIFAIMFENDGHSPQHCVDLPQTIKKITIKVSL
jgi:YhcH/YjgK/YiaL family protein